MYYVKLLFTSQLSAELPPSPQGCIIVMFTSQLSTGLPPSTQGCIIVLFTSQLSTGLPPTTQGCIIVLFTSQLSTGLPPSTQGWMIVNPWLATLIKCYIRKKKKSLSCPSRQKMGVGGGEETNKTSEDSLMDQKVCKQFGFSNIQLVMGAQVTYTQENMLRSNQIFYIFFCLNYPAIKIYDIPLPPFSFRVRLLN